VDRKKPSPPEPREYAVIHRQRLSIRPTYTEAWKDLRKLVDGRKIPYESCEAALKSGEYVIEPPGPQIPMRSR
jgi:hypothetical protein